MKRLTKKRNGGERGFTLMEMLVVLVLIGLIAAVAIPQISKLMGSAKSKAARIQLETLSRSLSFYELDNGALPTEEEGLDALWERPGELVTWNGPYVRGETQLDDPWGRRILYRVPGENAPFALTTFGADGREGGTGEDADIILHP